MSENEIVAWARENTRRWWLLPGNDATECEADAAANDDSIIVRFLAQQLMNAMICGSLVESELSERGKRQLWNW